MALDVAISKSLPNFQLDVRFSAGPEPLALLGASGSGKSMTLRAIAGLLRPDAGRIALGGRALFDAAERVNVPGRARRVGLVFQNYALFPHLTVARNVGYGIAALRETERAARVDELLRQMQLEEIARRYPGQLSGGQQQLVALMRALAPDPDVLLLDEPLSALDVHLRGQVERHLIAALGAYRGVAIYVSHNLAEAYRLCPRLVVLEHGRSVAAGNTEEIFRRPPTVGVARVTGCKNFSRARATASGEVEALDWNCLLRVAEPIPASAGHVAIRAHHICLLPPEDSSHPRAENAFPCWVAAVTHGPFDVTLYLRLHAPPSSASDYHLQADIPTERWEELSAHAFPWSARLAPDRLMLLSG